MVKSRSSTSSIFRSALHSDHSLSSYDSGSVITFRPSEPRPPPLNLSRAGHGHGHGTGHGSGSGSKSHKVSQPPSLPVTPGTPTSSFPHDPFSHPTLPEPTRSRPGSLAHTLERAGKGPQIVVASPSTSTIHYLFPSAPSTTGVHLQPEDKLARGGSQRRKKQHPADAFSAGTRRAKEEGRTHRLASEPTLGLSASKTFDAGSMRTLRRQPSLVDLGSRAWTKDDLREKLVEEKKKRPDRLKGFTSNSVADFKPLSPTDISTPILLSPKSTTANRRRSLSLSSPRPAPAIPGLDLSPPVSPQIPSPNFGRPLGIEVGDIILPGSTSTYTRTEHSGNGAVPFINPFFPMPMPVPGLGGVPMERSPANRSIPVDPDFIAAREDAARKLVARQADHMSTITEDPTTRERRLSLTGRVRRSLSLKLTSDTKAIRRRSQSVTSKGEKVWDHYGLPPPLPNPTSTPAGYVYNLGVGDPSVDMDDKYGLAKIIPTSQSVGLGLEVRIGSDDIGARSPQRKRINLSGGSDVSLLASSMATGLGFDSPLSLPESLIEEAVDLTERGRMVVSPIPSYSASYSGSYVSTPNSDRPSLRASSAHTPALTNTSTPCLPSSSQFSSSSFPTPFQTPHIGHTPHLSSGPLASPAIISPNLPSLSTGQDHTTRYAPTSRKPNLRYSKSFSSDVSAKVSRSFSWRTKPASSSAETDSSTREKRLSRSFSFATRTRSPVPPEMRPPVEVIPMITSNPIISGPPIRPPRALQRQPSTGDINHRWRPPTIYNICSPANAVDSLPTPPRKHLSPHLAVSVPNTPDFGMVGPHDRKTSGSSTGTGGGAKSFLSASSSFRGLTKSLTKSFSVTFGRNASTDVRSADSALKSRISSPLEAESQHHQTIQEIDHRIHVHGRDGKGSQEEIMPDFSPQTGRNGSKEWRASLLAKAVSRSIEDGLSEMVDYHRAEVGSMGRSERTTKWSRSVGKTFGLRSSSVSASTSAGVSRDSNVFPIRTQQTLGETSSSRGLKEIGKQESNMSMYSTASYLPFRQPGSAQIQGPPIHISHYSPPKPSTGAASSGSMINFSHPRPPTLELNLTRLPSPPLLDDIDLPHFPPVPTISHAIFRPPTPPISPPRPASESTGTGSKSYSPPSPEMYQPQPLLSRLSAIPDSGASTGAKEHRVAKVLRWRRDIGEEVGNDIALAMGRLEVDSGEMSDETGAGNVEEVEAEGKRLDGLIQEHVMEEKERLRGIVRRKSIDAGLGF